MSAPIVICLCILILLWCLMFSDYLVTVNITKKDLIAKGEFSIIGYAIGLTIGLTLRIAMLIGVVLLALAAGGLL